MALAGGAVRRMIFWIPPVAAGGYAIAAWRCRPLASVRDTGLWGLHWDHEVFQGAAAAKLLARRMMPISIMRPPQHGARSSERPVSCW
jgi:hypothetical protein